MKRFRNIFKSQVDQPVAAVVTIVSGLPRSGTSMMMKMLEAAGLEVVSDGLREADGDNPKGYYEYERVKALDKGDVVWVDEATGKVVKVISALLEYLPAGYEYRVLFMNRRMEEILASQRKMIDHRGEKAIVDDAKIGELLTKHVRKVKAWMAEQPNFAVLELDYNAMLADPQPSVRRVNAFLNNELDEQAMVSVVDPELYRNRAAMNDNSAQVYWNRGSRVKQ